MSSTGDKFNDLYSLSKRLQSKPKQDRTSEEIEYEKYRNECTFAPSNVRGRNSSRTLQNNTHEPNL